MQDHFKRTIWINRFVTLLLLAVLSSVGYAQEPTVQEPSAVEATPVYDIEIIVFEYVNGVRGSREDWAYIDTGRPDAERAAALLQPMESELDEDEDSSQLETNVPPSPPVAFSFTPLDPAAYRLGDQYQRLRGSRDYRPILHTAWRQPVYPEENESTLQLSSVARTPAALGGDISLFVNRFLHLSLDLRLAADRNGAESLVYKLNERRKMRSAELHFFDHPRFGALALISRTDDTNTQ